MEQSCSRLYSGPLSPAAQKILAVLRAQSGYAIRLNHGFSNSNSQMVQSYHGSQRELLDQSTWRLSQRESRVEDRPWSWSQESSTSYWDSSKHWSPQTSFSHQPLQTPDCALSSQTSSSSSSSSWESSLQRHLSQTKVYYQCSQTDPKRHYPEPHAYQCSQPLPFNQHEVAETAASFCRRDRFNASPQIGDTQSIHQSTVRRNSPDEIRPSFNGILSSVDGVSDKALLPTMEDAYNHEDESSLDGATLYSCFKICHVTESNTSGSQKKKSTESWSIPTNEHEGTSCSDGRPKRKLPLSNTADEATSGHKGRRTRTDLLTQCAIGGICLPLTVSVGRRETCCDSLRPTRNLVVQDGAGLSMTSGSGTEEGREQLSVIGDEIEDGVAWREKGDRDASLLIGKANEMISIGLPKSPGLSTSIMMGKILDCYTEGEVFWKKEEKNVEYGHIIPEIREAVDLPCSENKDISVGFNDERPTILSVSLEREDQRVSHSKAQNTEDMKHHTENLAVQPGTKLIEDDNFVYNLKGTTERGIYAVEVETERCKKALIDIHIEDIKHQKEALFCSDIQMGEKQFETDHKKVTDFHGPDADLGESGEDRDDSIMPPADNDGCPSISTSTEDSEECTAIMSGPDFKTPCPQQHDNLQTVHGSIGGNSSGLVLATSNTFATASNFSLAQNLASTPIKASTELETGNMLTSQTHSHDPPLKFSLLLKRKCETLDHQSTKINPTGHSAKWEPPLRKGEKRVVNYLKRSRPKNPSLQPSAVLDIQKQTQQIWPKKVTESYSESGTNASKQSPSSMTCKQPNQKRAKSGPDQITRGPKIPPEGAKDGETKNQSKASCLTATLTSDPRVMDCWKLNLEEKMQILEEVRGGKALVLTLVHQDGTTQLDPELKFSPAACGILILMRNSFDSSTAKDSLGPNDNLIYLKLEQRPAWAQLQTEQNYELFLRDMLQQMLSGSQLVVCYKAKDFLRTALQFYRRDISWKQVAGCQIQDPQVSGWLLDPSNPSSCYQDLLSKHCKIPCVTPALGAKKISQVISGLCSLYWLNMELCSKLQKQGLWELYSNMELKMIPVLAAMESHQIHVDKEALKRMSDLLGAKMKQLEQEAHRAAGQIFLVTSNSQLRTVLFEKLCLHERCENKKLPKTVNKQQSTSEAALLQLQDLHPLPKIILEYRQNYISSTWHQTSAVTGRISAKHPNFQALPRQPLYVTKKQYIQGKEEEVVCVHPRAMFIPQEGWSFLAADFCQVELRLLAHLSSDPVLLCHFSHPQSDIFTILASQWKDLSETEVTSEDREHAKRVVYSVVYGAGRERLSGILGVSTEQASRFQDSFLQTYKDVQPFIQRTIQQCHKKGYVLSIMGRRRTLPNISSPDWAIRMQAERQAVNFVVQGSAADLCKMAMIRIFNLVSSSSSLSARLIAQLHDELLYEVEDSQVGQFAALVKTTMESLQHIDHLGVHLKVPLRVAVSSGKSWGSMCELNILPAPPPSSL